MIKIENIKSFGLEEAVRGMRNPMNSWDKSDSRWLIPWNVLDDSKENEVKYELGSNDLNLAKRLSDGGPVHGKFKRMITVYMDITAPLYWWKEFDTYKVGTVANSCSTMHKIHAKEFTLEDFSHEHLIQLDILDQIVFWLNTYRDKFLETKDKDYWWQMIKLLPSSYNQKRTVMVNYEVLTNIYHYRKDHKLDEWHDFCDMIERLPYAEDLIVGNGVN